MLSPIQIVQKQIRDEKRDALLLKIASDLVGMHEEFLKQIRDFKLPEKIIQKGDRGFAGKDGKDGWSPTESYLIGLIHPLIPKAKDGEKPTKEELLKLITPLIPQISEERVAKIAAALVRSTLPKQPSIEELFKSKKFTVKDISGLEQTLSAIKNQTRQGYLHGGGVPSLSAGANITLTPKNDGGYTVSSTGGGSLTEIVITGTRNDSNLIFTAPSQPSYLVINGSWYKPTGGSTTWSYVAGTITLSTPVGTNGVIWGF